MTPKPSGQIMIGAIILLVILAILVPAIITHIQHEADWTLKETRTTRAFQLAESAVERGFQQVILSTSNWATIQAGGTLTGFNFNQTYNDMSGGTYEIKISQGPGTQAATITGCARDSASKEIRAIKAVYSNSASNAALYAQGGLTLASNPSVEWGPILSPNSIITDKNHPRFYSKSDISLDANGATPPNSDNIQWWSYYTNLPPAPEIDTEAYRSSATAQGAGHVRVAGSYQMRTDICGGAASCTGVYYFSGDTTLGPPMGIY